MNMALGKSCSSTKPSRGAVSKTEELGFEFVRYTRSFRRKRILISNSADSFSLDSPSISPLKKACSETLIVDPVESPLESLPQDILIRIICGVDHDDLKQLFHVSKAIRESTLIAKNSHFAYSTPRKFQPVRYSVDYGKQNDFEEFEEPKAPKHKRSCKSRLSLNSLAELSVSLFSSPRKRSFSTEPNSTVMPQLL